MKYIKFILSLFLYLLYSLLYPFFKSYLIFDIILSIILIVFLCIINIVNFKNKIDFKTIFKSFVITLIFTFVILLMVYILNKLGLESINQINIINSLNNLYIIKLIIFIPIVEEIVFRYSFRFINNTYLYIIISSLIFSLLHIIGSNILYLIPYSLIGIMLCYIYVKTDNILCSMLSHMFYNLINLLLFL